MTRSYANTASRDYKVVDATETVTFTSKKTAGNTPLTITKADGHDFTAREVAAAGGLWQMGDKRWGLGANQITAGNEPQAGDTITDASNVVWQVLDAILDDLGISWFCTCRRSR